MYNGIGLTTPRGSGTNGHVQRNWAVVRPREKDRSYRTEGDLAALDSAANKQPNKDILDHDRKRKIELKCAEFADILEEQGYSEGAITNKVNNYRNMLLNHDGKVDKAVDQWGRPSVTETHQVAEAQQEKNAKLRQAFGISEYFVDGSSFDPDREAKEQVARSNALLERERQQLLDKAQAQRYQLVQTPSPEPEALNQKAETEGKKNKKRKHRDSSSSEEASSSRKKKKSKKRSKKERSEKSKNKKAKKKQRRSSKASSDDSDDTGGSSNEDSTSDEDRKRKKRKKKEKKKLKKKQASSKSSDTSRDSSLETRKQKSAQQQKYKAPDKNDFTKSTASKVDQHHRGSHDENRRRYSHTKSPVQKDRGRDRRSRSRERDNNHRGYNSKKRSPDERSQQYSPKRSDKFDPKYKTTTKNTRSRSPSSEHERGTRSRKCDNERNADERQHRSTSQDKGSHSRSTKTNKRQIDSRYRSRSKSSGRRSKSNSIEKVKQRKTYSKKSRSKSISVERALPKSYSKQSRSNSNEQPSRLKSRRSYSKSPEVAWQRHTESKQTRRSRSNDRNKRKVSPKPVQKSNHDRSLSPQIIARRSLSTSPQNDRYSYKRSVSQDRIKNTSSKLPSRHRSKSLEKRQENSRSKRGRSNSLRKDSSSPYDIKKQSPSPKQSLNKKCKEDDYKESRAKRLKEDEIPTRSSHGKSRRRSTSSEERYRGSRDSKNTKNSTDKCSPREMSISPERMSTLKKDLPKKKDIMVEVLSKINDDVSHKPKNSRKTKSFKDAASRDRSSSPDDRYSNRAETVRQKNLMEEVISKINDDRSQRVIATQIIHAKTSKDISRSPDYRSSKRSDADKQKLLMAEVLSKINADKPALKDTKQSERYNRYRTPSPDPKSLRNSETMKQKSLMEEVISKINDISKSTKSTTPPRSSRFSESEKHQEKTPKSSTKNREQKPVVCLRSTSDDENSNIGNEHEENSEHIENEMRVLRMLKSGLAAKAKESLERKRVLKKRTPSPTRKTIDPNTFDIQGPGSVLEKRDTNVDKVAQAQLFPSYDILVKEAKKGSVRESASSTSPVKKSKDKDRKSRSRSAESQSTSRSRKRKDRKSRSRSKTKRKGRKSASSSSASSFSSGHRSSSSSSSSSDSSRSSRSRSRSSSGSRSSSSSSRSRSPSIPRRHGSPSFLDRRRITSARKRPIPYHRASPSTSPSSVSSYSSASPWYQRERNRNNATTEVSTADPISPSVSVDRFRSPVGSPQHTIAEEESPQDIH